MPGVMAAPQRTSVVVEIGGLPIALHCGNPAFIRLVTKRYAGYVANSEQAAFDFDIEIAPPGSGTGAEAVW